jgi:hypothetical protein
VSWRVIVVVAAVLALAFVGAGIYERNNPPLGCMGSSDRWGRPTCGQHIYKQNIADQRSDYFFFGAAVVVVLAGVLITVTRPNRG